jgi:hypothetical protein
VKQAADEGSLQMLRREALVYRGVSGPFLPGFLGVADSEERALLAVEFLDGASCHAPAGPARVRAVAVSLGTRRGRSRVVPRPRAPLS